MHQYWIRLFIVIGCLFSIPLKAEIRGKVDLGAALLYIDILKSGKTEKSLQMVGFKADSTVLVYSGFAIKPNVIYAQDGKRGWVVTGGAAVGFYFPVTEKLKVLPNVGMAWSDFRAKVVMDPFGPIPVTEKFRSESPYIGMDLSYALSPKWTLILAYQYAWSKTDTIIKFYDPTGKKLHIKDKSHSDGPNYSAGMEYAINDQWAINFGVGYNITLSHEKHGLRGKGMKLGMAYYF